MKLSYSIRKSVLAASVMVAMAAMSTPPQAGEAYVGTRLSPGSVSARLPEAAGQALPPEVKVGTSAIIDFEFDWGRDGVYCPQCNFGTGNARLVYFDQKTFEMWVGDVDVNTGNFYPEDGKGTRVATNIANHVGNGPEWMFSSRDSEIVYTTYLEGKPRAAEYMTIGAAQMSAGSWVASIVPGTSPRKGPIGSLNLDDLAPRAHYRSSTSGELHWRDVWSASPEVQFPKLPRGTTSRRWVVGTRRIIMNGSVADHVTGAFYKQVFLYDTNTGSVEQLTFDPVNKEQGVFMFQAPEFGNEFVFFTVTEGTHLNIYRKMPDASGSLRWAVVNTIAMPTDTPYIGSPEAFVHNGRSWVFFYLSSQSPDSGVGVSTRIAMTGIDPATPSLKVLTSLDPPRFRSDPEYFVTANGPYIYYNRYWLPNEKHRSVANEGIYRVDTGLGPRNP